MTLVHGPGCQTTDWNSNTDDDDAADDDTSGDDDDGGDEGADGDGGEVAASCDPLPLKTEGQLTVATGARQRDVKEATVESSLRFADAFPEHEEAPVVLGAAADELVLTRNTTEGMNLVASSLDLESGDEVILADHEHTSGTIPWIYWQETKGIKINSRRTR